jgi:hypothetical protein
MILDQNRERHSNIDTKTPLYSSRILVTYLEFIKKYYPDFDIDSALKYAGTTRHEVEDAGHWFNQEQTDRFHEILVAKTGNPNIARDAGRFDVPDGGQACQQFDAGVYLKGKKNSRQPGRNFIHTRIRRKRETIPVSKQTRNPGVCCKIIHGSVCRG